VVLSMLHLAVEFATNLTRATFRSIVVVMMIWRLKVPLQDVEWVHSCPFPSMDEEPFQLPATMVILGS